MKRKCFVIDWNCNKGYLPLFVLLLLFTPFEVPCGPDSTEEVERSILEEWRETLRFGIDSEVLLVVKQMRERREISLHDELLLVLGSSPNSEVRIAILEYLRELKEDAARSEAFLILEEYEDLDEALVIAVIHYLSEIGVDKGYEIFMEMVEYHKTAVASTAITALGRGNVSLHHRKAISELLLEKLLDIEFNEALREDLILALGRLGNRAAVDPLIELMESSDSEKMERMYAAEALGWIGDSKAIPALRSLFSEKDAMLRAYAASGLSRFVLADVIDILIEGLKDTNWKVRITSAKGLARPEATKALDILIYKAKKDPENAVRIEACKALGEMGQKQGLDLLRELFSHAGTNLELRQVCLDVLIEKDLSASIGAIKKVVEQDLDKPLFKSRMLELTSRRLARVKSSQLKSVFLLMLKSNNVSVRVQAIRGISYNGFSDLKGDVDKMAKEDPYTSVRKEALATLENW